MRVVIAPDSFKGSAGAREAAEALGRGWHGVRPDDEIVLRPMADGGEGTLDAFEAAVPGSVRHSVTVSGPFGAAVDASWLALPDGTAVVELASTSGITLVRPDELRAQDASTFGFGQAIAAALEAGADRLLLAVGSSCSTDGGAGALLALGAVLADTDGTAVAPGARGLPSIHTVDLAGLPPLPARSAVIVSDVTNPLLGPRGAAAVFGPQKGATPHDVVAMDSALAHFAFSLALGGVSVEPATPGAGAAGGTAFGLLAWGATVTSGARAVADAIGLADDLGPDTVVITGEGRFDAQSESGKVPTFVRGLVEAAGARTLLVAGSIEAETVGFDAAESLVEVAGSRESALSDTLPALEAAARRLAERISGATPAAPDARTPAPRVPAPLDAAPRPTSPAQLDAWQRGAVPWLERVRDDVWALGLAMEGDHLPYSLLYLLRDSEGGVHVVDPGTDSDANFDAVAAALTTLGASWTDLRTITVTHLHPDHLGMADRLRQASGADVALSGAEADALARLGDLRLTADEVAERATAWGVPEPRVAELADAAGRVPDYPRVTADRRLDDGHNLGIPGFSLRALTTPGHTPGHLCLVDEPRSLLFSGDHILPTLFAGLSLGGPTRSNPLADYVDSCERVAALGDLEVLPGHGYRFRGLTERAHDSAGHHLRRTGEVAGVLSADPAASVWTIASQLTWTAGWEKLSGFFLWSALSQTEMHRAYVRSGRMV